MGCGCGGGGSATYSGMQTVGSGDPQPGQWRVSWNDGTNQQFRDWPNQIEAFAHAGIVGGTISRAF